MATPLLLLLGLVALVAGAEVLVRGSAKLALRLGVSPLVVGLTVVAYGTSSPELAVSIQSASEGRGDLAIGNVVGSNIFNVLGILGVSAIITPLVVSAQIIRQEVPVMILVSLLLMGLAADGGITRPEGALLATCLALYTTFLVVQSRRTTHDQREPNTRPAPIAWDDRLPGQLIAIVSGLGLLVAGSQALVTAATRVATALGVSELVIGLTIVAVGTSLPEVATSILAAVRGQRDIAVGNVVGSNVFNVLGVVGASAMVAPGSLGVSPSVRHFDLPVMLAAAVACLPIFFTGQSIARWEGLLLFGYWMAYTGYLLLDAQGHDMLGTYRAAMATIVLPLTMLTIAIIIVREVRTTRRQPRAGTR